jgi:hypothetical protein
MYKRIYLSEATWDRLMRCKLPGEDADDVVSRLLLAAFPQYAGIGAVMAEVYRPDSKEASKPE